MGASLSKGRERAMHLENGHHMTEFTIKATEEGEHHMAVTDGVAELGQ
jgi:hypothetical protein